MQTQFELSFEEYYDLGMWRFIKELFLWCLPYASTISDAGDAKIRGSLVL